MALGPITIYLNEPEKYNPLTDGQEDNFWIEKVSDVNAVIYSAIYEAVEKTSPTPIKVGLKIMENSGGGLQVILAAGTENEGRERAEFLGGVIGGIIGTLAASLIPIPGARVASGYLGSKGGEIAAQIIYDYFIQSIEATQVNPQIAINHDPAIKSVINTLEHQISQNNQIDQFTFDTPTKPSRTGKTPKYSISTTKVNMRSTPLIPPLTTSAIYSTSKKPCSKNYKMVG